MRVGKPIGDKNANASLNVSPTNVGVNFGAQKGDVSANVNVGFNPAEGSFGTVSPTVQIGNSDSAKVGKVVGSIGGQVIAGPVGGLVGSAAGSAIGSAVDETVNFGKKVFGANSKGRRERKAREKVSSSLFGSSPQMQYPDGTIWDFSQNTHDPDHTWKDPSKGVEGRTDLRRYDVDFTNDMDYVAGMAGITISRLLNGGSNTAIDQVGSEIGNSFLGKVGYGANFTEENFNNATTNARSFYSQRGIDSKEEMLSLASKANSEGRLSDPDYAVAQQVAGMIYDKDFNLATQLMSGRLKGLQTAGKSASNSSSTAPQEGVNRPGRIYSPVLSPEEAFLSVQPLIDQYQRLAGSRPKGASGTARDNASAAGAISGVVGIAKQLDKLTGGRFAQGIQDLLGLGESDSFELPNVFDQDVTDVIAGEDIPGDFELPSFEDSVSDIANSDIDVSDIGSDVGGDFQLPDFSF